GRQRRWRETRPHGFSGGHPGRSAPEVSALEAKLVDSHCHLNDAQFDPDRDAVIERALAAGVGTMMVIDAPEFAESYPFMYATIGVHPHEAAKATEETFARIRDLASHPKVVAVGEIGLDYHYDFSPR